MAAAWNQTSGTLSNNTATIAARANRRRLIVSNNSDTVMTLSFNGITATASVGISVPAGTAIVIGGQENVSLAPETAFSLFCAGSSKAYTYVEC